MCASASMTYCLRASEGTTTDGTNHHMDSRESGKCVLLCFVLSDLSFTNMEAKNVLLCGICLVLHDVEQIIF